MKTGPSQSKPPAEIAGAVAGRIRLRVLGNKSSAELAVLAESLEALPEVARIEVRPLSGSVIIEFDPGATATLEGQLHGMGIQPKKAGKTPAVRDPATTIRAAATAIDRAVAKWVPGANLRLLVPLTLGLLSVRQFVRGDDRLSEAPWYLLAAYAADSFARLQGGSRSPTPTATVGGLHALDD